VCAASFFDGPVADKPVAVAKTALATSAAKEHAILKYTKALAQCKAAAHKPSNAVVKAAFEKVHKAMGGSLGENAKIDYTAESGEEAREGQLLCAALLDHFSALKGSSRALSSIEENWRVACAQADEDSSGTISKKEATAIWDRILIEAARTFGSKLDKLGVNPISHLLEAGDLCMVRPLPSEASAAVSRRALEPAQTAPVRLWSAGLTLRACERWDTQGACLCRKAGAQTAPTPEARGGRHGPVALTKLRVACSRAVGSRSALLGDLRRRVACRLL
jgi:hypothetical protein